MTDALTLQTHAVTRELFAELRHIDARTWRNETEARLRERLAAIRTRVGELAREAERRVEPAHRRLCDGLQSLAAALDAHVPAPGLAADRAGAAWLGFRHAVQSPYESVAVSLRAWRLHVPPLRPTNFRRSLFHVSSGLACIVILQHVLAPPAISAVSAACAAVCWFLEFARRRSEPLNRALMRFFAPIAHGHETERVNSATWFTTAMALIALPQEPLAASMGVAVLALADPAAGIVGRRYGRHALRHGRTLEGSLTFVVVGTLAAAAALVVYYPHLPAGVRATLVAAAVLPAALAELLSRRLDDNLTIPVTATAGALIAGHFIGL